MFSSETLMAGLTAVKLEEGPEGLDSEDAQKELIALQDRMLCVGAHGIQHVYIAVNHPIHQTKLPFFAASAGTQGGNDHRHRWYHS